MSYDWGKHWERVSAAYVAEFGIPWLGVAPPNQDDIAAARWKAIVDGSITPVEVDINQL